MKRHLAGIGAVGALALIPVAHSAIQPRTTAPPQVITVKIMITDSAIHMTPKAAPRGDLGRFILVNSGKKRHVFSLGHQRRQTGTQTGFVKALKPGEQSVLILFLDYRGKLPYLGTLPEDRTKARMKGIFTIT